MRRTLLLLLAALSFAVPASGPARAGEPQVQALVVDAPSERPGYRMRAVALKNLGERSIRVAPGQRLMAPRREPDTCGAVGPRDRTSRLGAGKTMLVPVFLYAEGEAPQSDDPLFKLDAHIAVPVLPRESDGGCEAPLVWTPNTLATPAFSVLADQEGRTLAPERGRPAAVRSSAADVRP